MEKKLITAADNVISKPPEAFVYWCITSIMPKIDENGKAFLNPDKTPFYETNYFCRRMISKVNGIYVIEWDTDCHYAQRFRTESGATNYWRVVLEKLDGCKIEKHPFSL